MFGRGSECDVRICAPLVSREHCRLTVRDDGFLLEDLDSGNGTWVHGHRIDQVVLELGARFTIGGVTLEIGPGGVLDEVSRPGLRRMLAAGESPAADSESGQESVRGAPWFWVTGALALGCFAILASPPSQGGRRAASVSSTMASTPLPQSSANFAVGPSLAGFDDLLVGLLADGSAEPESSVPEVLTPTAADLAAPADFAASWQTARAASGPVSFDHERRLLPESPPDPAEESAGESVEVNAPGETVVLDLMGPEFLPDLQQLPELLASGLEALRKYHIPEYSLAPMANIVPAITRHDDADAARTLVALHEEACDLARIVARRVSAISRQSGGSSNEQQLRISLVKLLKQQHTTLLSLREAVEEGVSGLSASDAFVALLVEIDKKHYDSLESLAFARVSELRSLAVVPVLTEWLPRGDWKRRKAVREVLATIVGEDLGSRRSAWQDWWETTGRGQ